MSLITIDLSLSGKLSQAFYSFHNVVKYGYINNQQN